ncbi:hypothetical protein RHO15_10020 [Utexia brackfieldae]|uniref:hypothetical protein n=1 Tax=Utexia brackfieldae TaxID=3074108 RepID=UPI00370DD813
MIPDYFTFIRFHDKRMQLMVSLIVLLVFGFYWKNSTFSITANDSGLIGGILALLLFNFIYELQAYWAYSWGVGRVDVNDFGGQRFSTIAIFLSRPEIVSLFSFGIFWIIVKGCLTLLSGAYSLVSLLILSLCYILLIIRFLRRIYIRQMLVSISCSPRFKSMSQYVAYSLFFIIMLNILSVIPLKYQPAFSLEQGFTSPQLIIAMWILCMIVQAINQFFSLSSKRYIFLGRVFLKEIDLLFSQSVPWPTMYAKSMISRMVLLLIVELFWIILVSVLLHVFNVIFNFEGYFILCFLPCIGYHFLHLYWRWHSDFLMACDMYLRFDECQKRGG